MSLPSCEIDADCGEGYVCLGGRCVLDTGGGGAPPDALPGLGGFLRKRYTSNVAVTEQMPAIDLLNEVLFPAMRGYLAQNEKGQLALRNKKPVPYAFGTSVFTAGDTVLNVDNVADWVGNLGNWVLISPHTNKSEVRAPSAATYPTAQNSIVLSSTGGLFTITGFAGCDNASTPATATIQVTGLGSPPVDCSITLESTTFTFMTSSSDTDASIASYIAGVIASHPSLFRRFTVEFDGVDTVTLTARWGKLTVPAIANTTSAPVADPSTAPTLTAAGSGSLAAGDYSVGYSYVNASGETLLSPYKVVTLSANQKINVTTVTLPAGVTSLNWYCSPEANSTKLRFLVNNDGTGFSIDAPLPLLSATLPPDLNRTGCEVMRISAVYSDRAETRTGLTRSNIIRASMVWSMGKKDDTVNEVQLKYRDSSDDWRLVTLKLRDDANIAKIKATKSKEINGQAIDNTDQAYRIASGELSLRQDCNFFYSITATRKALLQQEGDVICITDDGSGVYNIPVFVEELAFDTDGKGLPQVTLTARKYGSRVFDDSVVEAVIPVVSEAAVSR